MNRTPMYQGKLDGLCGFYSVINSLISLNYLPDDKSCHKLMKNLIIYKTELFPSVMYEGMAITHVVDLITESSNMLNINLHITRPFTYKNKIKTSVEFISKLEKIIVKDKSIAIVSICAPWNHWTVLTEINDNKFHFFDSTGLFESDITDIELSTSKELDKLRFNSRETILISI